MSGEPEILFEKRGRAGLVTLNRPRALNALTLGMVRQLQARLAEWAEDPQVFHVIVRAAGDRAFCAGGDIRQLYEWGRAQDPLVVEFYREEYRLNTFIKRYPKPYIALIDGIVMGGGAGVSVHGSHRMGGSRTAFAMPETGIGLFPDVGGTYFLPRLPGELGTYLALTGARLDQADALWAGIITHRADSDEIERAIAGLCDTEDADAALAPFVKSRPQPGIARLMPAIDHCFSGQTVEEVLERLDRHAGEHAEWARATAATIRTKSPTSLKIALRQMREGMKLDFEDCMRIEFRIVNRVVKGTDFYEGVRAVIIDKDSRPKWRPAELSSVSDADIDAYFAPLGQNELHLS